MLNFISSWSTVKVKSTFPGAINYFMEFAKQTLKQKDGKSRLFAVSSGARLGSGTFGIGVRNDHKQLTSSLIIMMPDEE